MDDDGVDADLLEQNHVQGELPLEVGVHHGVTAIFNYDRLVAELLHIGKGFHQDLGPFHAILVHGCSEMVFISYDRYPRK